MILKVKNENGQFKEVVLKGLKGDKGEDGTVLQQKEIDNIKSSLDNKANKDHTHPLQVNCDTVDNLHLICLTQTEYDGLAVKDSNTLYFIREEE